MSDDTDMKQAPEPLTFTHNGEPATIDLERFKPQPQIEQPAPVEAARPAPPEPLTFTHNGEPATIDLARYEQRPVDPQPLTFTHNGELATINLEQFKTQKEKHMKHGEIGAPRNTGDAGVGTVPEVGSLKVVILNGSRQIDKVVPGVGADGAAGWQTQQVLSENGLKKGIYQLSGATDASKKVHPQQFGGQVLHVDKQNVYQFGPDDGKGKSTIVKHDRKIFDQALDGKEPVVGQCYEVSYARGIGKVKGELTQEEGQKLQNRKVNKM
ncbi:KfrB domain-containing protein [Pseudomonas sp. S2.OTC.A_B10]|uniref:KfrB domain-containing protein n=1 Tax=Pseudomonas sp. S2.OTC.A_B10 TaxID=3237018 RepID=UPI003CF3AFCD